MEEGVWKYFKKGDIVRCEVIWDKKLFIIHSLHGNAYCPLMTVYQIGKPQTNGNLCNFDIRRTKLVSSSERPYKKLKTPVIVKLMRKGNIEAKREFLIRNTK